MFNFVFIILSVCGLCLAAGTLKYTDCNTSPNKVLHASNAHLSADPIHIPGSETGDVDLQILRPISGNHFQLQVTVQKYVLLGYINMPCVSNVGSCNYELCDLLSGKTYNNTHHCPLEIAQSSPDFPCACPFQPGNYHLNPTTFQIPELSGLFTFLAAGDYKVHLRLVDTATTEQVGCYDIEISTEGDCSGLSCLIG